MHEIDFGPRMDEAVRLFQRSKRLKDDGVVGRLTWSALGLSLDISHRVTLASQPTSNTCYAAAATMVLGPIGSKSFAPGPNPPGINPDDHWARSFVRQFSWSLEYGMTPMPQALAAFLRSGPFWLAGNLPFPTGPSYHAVVVGSIWGDGSPDGTMLLLYDPWPVNRGERYGIMFGDYWRAYPQALRYVIHR
jgi:hypothetical protein